LNRWAWRGTASVALAGLGPGAVTAQEPIPPPSRPVLAQARPGQPAVPSPTVPPAAAPAPRALPGPADELPPLPPAPVAEPVPPGPRPGPLRRPVAPPEPTAATAAPATTAPPFLGIAQFFRYPMDPPSGYAGNSSVLPREAQSSDDFVPVEDRWRMGMPTWDRYGRGHPIGDDYPYMPGRLADPFNQNILKGDFPFAGQHTFFELTALANLIFEAREVPTPTTPFEATERPFTERFFGRPNQFFTTNTFSLNLDFFQGDAGFKPKDWSVVLTPTFNVNNLSVSELGIVSPNVLQGTSRTRTWWTLQQAFAEFKLADLSTEYDFVSIRAGTQPFVSDFRGFLFVDQNRGVRLFGTLNGNRDQWNLVYFRQWEKDTNSGLNTFNDRRQTLLFANIYRQDFIFPGYITQFSLNYDNDPRSIKFDKNRFLVRPDPTGIVRPHSVNVGYFGWAGDGHIGRYNISHQFYWAFGRDSLNPLANQAQTINAQMFAIEGSYDRDWVRFRTSLFWSSGDHNINNSHATGFDTILDAPNFAGGQFSYWNRQQIGLFGANLTQRLSLVPDLRSSKIQGQANFVNPGLFLVNNGVDFDITPKLKSINNFNIIWFDQTNVLERFIFDGNIDRFVGGDLSTGIEYRPLVSENLSILGGVSVLIPGQGFRNLFNNFNDRVDGLVASFLNVNILY
jgi:hypothetical protein